MLRIREGQAVHARLEAARRALEAARKTEAEMAEEARRAGALPGWLR